MNANTTPAIKGRYFKPITRLGSTKSKVALTDQEKVLEQRVSIKLTTMMTQSYEGIQAERLGRHMEIGECTYSLSFRTGVALSFPHLGGIIPIDQVNMIIETALGVHSADQRQCEQCERYLPVIFKYSRIPDHRPLGRWMKEFFIICPECFLFKHIREPIFLDADGM